MIGAQSLYCRPLFSALSTVNDSISDGSWVLYVDGGRDDLPKLADEYCHTKRRPNEHDGLFPVGKDCSSSKNPIVGQLTQYLRQHGAQQAAQYIYENRETIIEGVNRAISTAMFIMSFNERDWKKQYLKRSEVCIEYDETNNRVYLSHPQEENRRASHYQKAKPLLKPVEQPVSA
ncbi:MAG: hypothetical protein U0003_00455 [Vampirovibrionales bacterium]